MLCGCTGESFASERPRPSLRSGPTLKLTDSSDFTVTVFRVASLAHQSPQMACTQQTTRAVTRVPPSVTHLHGAQSMSLASSDTSSCSTTGFLAETTVQLAALFYGRAALRCLWPQGAEQAEQARRAHCKRMGTGTGAGGAR